MIALNGDTKAAASRSMPNDRQLQLRAKLGVGWSTFTSDLCLSEEEQNKIKFVIQKAELLEQAEQERIGTLVERYEHIRRQAKGNGTRQCVLCGDDSRSVISGSRICSDCRMVVCSKCSIEIVNKKKIAQQQQQQQQQQRQQIYLCKMCSEQKELWKKSGAWFFKSMPPYKATDRSASLLSLSCLGSSRDVLARCGNSTAAAAPEPVSSPRVQHKVTFGNCTSADAQQTATFGGCAASENRQLANLANPGQPWSRVRAEYSDDSPDSNDSSDDSTTHVKYRTYRLGEANVVTSPAATSETLTGKLHAQNSIALRLTEPHGSEATDALDVGTPFDACWQRPQRRSSVSSGATTTTAGSAQLSVTESCRDELLAGTAIGGCSGDAEADNFERVLTPSMPVVRRSGNRRTPRLFDSSWSVQSELTSVETPVVATTVPAQLHTSSSSSAATSQVQLSAPHLPSVQCAPLGSITFSLLYDPTQCKLQVHVFEGKHLPATSPYVRLNLIPGHGKAWKLKTRTRSKTVDPYWNDVLVYHGLEEDEVHAKTLRLIVKDDDVPATPTRRRAIGEYRLALSDLPASQLQRYCVPLNTVQQDKLAEKSLGFGPAVGGSSGCAPFRGKICLALLFNPAQALLHVTIVRCAALMAMDQNGYSDPYVKLYLKPDKSKKSKHKTAIRRKTLNPEYNEDFVYHFTRDDLTTRSLHVSVWDYDKVSKNDPIGGVVLACEAQASGDKAAKHWQALMDAPNVRHEVWHKLHVVGKGSSDDD